MLPSAVSAVRTRAELTNLPADARVLTPPRRGVDANIKKAAERPCRLEPSAPSERSAFMLRLSAFVRVPALQSASGACAAHSERFS